MRMNSTENPLIPCEEEKADVDFDAVVDDIIEQKEIVLLSLIS